MKSIFTTTVGAFIGLLAMAVPVTFRVDMSQVQVSPNGVHIAGAFQGWNPSATAMTLQGSGIYAVTLEIAPGTYAYKFINGNAWGTDEAVPQACGVDNGFGGFNRTVTVGAGSLVLDPVCFSSCAACVQQVFVDVTFRVNMAEQTVSPSGVHIAGSFQGWNPGGTSLSDTDADGVYEVTASILSGTTIQYKFINGNDWPQSETVPGACGVNDGFGGFNRSLQIGTSALMLDAVCFGACANCELPPGLFPITFSVDMSNETVSADGVHLAGDFQGWDPASTPMTDMGNGVYSVTVQIPEGTWTYAFINGNTFGGQEVVPAACGAANLNGGFDRAVQVVDAAITLPAVCFSSCEACVIVDPVLVSVTFQVNMSNETVSPDGVHIAGSFQGWNSNATPMTDEGNGIWSYTTELVEGTSVSYKFLNGNTWGTDESVPQACSTGGNRTLNVPGLATTLDVVCFGSCTNCDVVPQTVMVLFQVDMSSVSVSPQGVHVAGNFQGWNPNGSVMTSLGGSIYEILYPVEANTTIQFKFINGSEWSGSETVPSECGVSDGFGAFNRTIEVGTENVAFGPVCFSGCSACVPEVPVLVTFQVNMSNEAVGAEGVYVVGDFNNWDPTATMMSQFQPGLYQAVGVVNSGQTIEYKFLNGPDFTLEETVPGDCGVDNGFGGFNRSFTAGTESVTIPIVCFGECADCTGSGNVSVTFQVDMSQQTVSSNGVHIAGSFNNFSPAATPMTLSAPGIYSVTVSVDPNVQFFYKFINGNDFTGVESVPFACGVDDGFGGFNRTYTSTSSSVTLNEVCFGDCVDCIVGVDELAGSAPVLFPNPADGYLRIRPNAAGTAVACVFDSSGREVARIPGFGTSERMVEVSGWEAGIYLVRFEGTLHALRLVVK